MTHPMIKQRASRPRVTLCPHCGSRDQAVRQDNGLPPTDPDYTLLCLARVPQGQDSFDGRDLDAEVDAQGMVPCGMQWTPNDTDERD